MKAALPLALVLGVLAGAPAPVESADDLLAAADVATLAPRSFRARFHVVMPDAERDVEIWRDGPDRSLVRVLAPGEAGKYTVRIGPATWLITPRAKNPVKLGAALKLRGGAALDVLTSTSYARDYEIASSSPGSEGGRDVVRLELKRRKAAAAGLAPRVAYVVDAGSLRPLRIETFAPSGRPTATVTLSDWPASTGLPKAARLVDHLQSGATTEVSLIELEARDVPEGLFDLADPSTRRSLLEAPTP